ncbi:MAG TPA: DUF2269 family protein [Gaiellaceae bacterium]|nr:DUF2269 family protein [Gaiellaceae bacterium]
MYEWLLLVHVAGAIAFFAGMAVAAAGLLAARRRERPAEVELLLGLTRWGVLLVAVGTVLVLVFGAWLVEEGNWGWDGWVAWALALLVLSALLGGAGGRAPKRARLLAERLAREGDAPSEELRRLLRDPAAAWLNAGAAAAAVAVLALMVLKPDL